MRLRLPAGHRRCRRGGHQLHVRGLLRLPHGRRRPRRGVPDLHHPQLHRPDGQRRKRRSTWPRPATVAASGRSPASHHRPEESDRMTANSVTGRVWVFGDGLTTDAMYPRVRHEDGPPEAARQVFYEVRPGWTEQVRPGDIVVAGTQLRARLLAAGRVAVRRARRGRRWSPRSSTRCSSATRSMPGCPP